MTKINWLVGFLGSVLLALPISATHAATTLGLGSMTSSNFNEFTGEVANDGASFDVASAGDVNNDGYDDLLIGANGNDDAASGAGAVYLVYGQSGAYSSGSLGATSVVEFTGEAAGDSAGVSVAGAGDVNNDGYDDLLIGSFNYGATDIGAAYLIYGQADGLTSGSLGAASIVAFTGEATNDTAGSAVASAGDVNNDGYDDLLIATTDNDDAASGAGAAYLVYGQANTLTDRSLNATGIVEFMGEFTNDNAGISVAGAGDVNNDGYDDLLIGATGNDDSASGAGAAYLLFWPN